jgi:hypothetical protein
MYWYTRRDGVVRGPYPETQISRYILLGRIRDTDELRPGEGEWRAVSGYPEVIPEVMKLPATKESRQRLLLERMRLDERRPGSRREAGPDEPSGACAGFPERRRAEAPEPLGYRELEAPSPRGNRGGGRPYICTLVLIVLTGLGFLLSYPAQHAESDTTSDCSARPTPGVNWNNCDLSGMQSAGADLLGARMRNARLDGAQLRQARLAGADLRYASLDLSNLEAADLSGANLRGVALRGSDLRYAKLVEANLSYANLSGARLEGADLRGAILDHSIWVDRHACTAGSVGVCRRLPADLQTVD